MIWKIIEVENGKLKLLRGGGGGFLLVIIVRFRDIFFKGF